MPETESPASFASRQALESMYACLEGGQSFRLEAGAGAGKTYSLVKALTFLIERHRRSLPRRNQQIACITFTNVAKDEIESRTDRSPIIYCETNHAFCWSLIQGFQKQLRLLVQQMPAWQDRIAEFGDLGDRSIEYSLGHRSIKEKQVSLHHDDILPLTIELMANSKFRKLMADRFPIILIDEYQDTDANWIAAIKEHFLGKAGAPLFGFFGDHWQKIYGNGCGSIEHPAVKEIGKKANFRSVSTIVDCLNRIRPELPQFVENPEDVGDVRVIHSNAWSGPRQTGAHWGGDLPSEIAHSFLERAKGALSESGWDFSPEKTKILMLTHRSLATEQGYPTLPSTFRYNEAFTKKEHPLVAFLVDVLEPAAEAFSEKRYGAMFAALGGAVPLVRKRSDKVAWFGAMNSLNEIRQHGTVGQVVDHLRTTRHPRLPDGIVERDDEAKSFDPTSATEAAPALIEWMKFRDVPYVEVKALRKYLDGHSPFETKHGVKGAEFENVLVVIGRGWNQYNFGEMLELAGTGQVPAAKAAMFERNRNLFYVACSRPRRRLALLFTQKLSDTALGTLANWFGANSLRAASF
ncbi:DNA helicase-2/ATP-dependent DNA helicase PcrA [Rhodopseudomonas thermotolerans]|uniref:DNA 3'-5' helicase II n=2 Tax=Rhodopseudomonas TaxID=1073 RepID=A0A336K4Y0_9BRAD|nr:MULTISPECIES: UvrD-helicase domain-containing protein [Rhodopseudomonas]RED25549.1 DNA helicase-2/ATP-dependent DNA helicase PcrA [Rhodopseudomonas pentothenatexigens]REF90379.1 DNA helicase-2/ATP-dependent DNA helicase PcrA [Rhodopseudomonas thermotolerans]SSW93161.1 DNA helicase-2/ATP-dependent DNA helicase PcrA [Rhodopseudomonas pentothenatexigens]